MPLESYGCSVCGKQAPASCRKHGQFKKRLAWLRRHYKRFHPKAFREWYRK